MVGGGGGGKVMHFVNEGPQKYRSINVCLSGVSAV